LPLNPKTFYLITMDQMDQHWVNVMPDAKGSFELANVNYK
jgi:hypothetical protein